ncbi:MAG: hypothetical protein CME64_09445 [Halobacteriovoraceae bacterium]|nr:hypothetical protein [Halobacteriovoraceae bacterium]
MKNILGLMLASQLFLMVGCGDLFMGKEKKTSLSQLLTCRVDPSAISKVFTENIKGDLHCLEESLNLFVDVVRSDRPGNLSYEELKKYISKNVEDLQGGILEALKGVFQLNSLLSGDDPYYIKKENIGGLVKTLIIVNEQMVHNNIYELFTSKTPLTYDDHLKRKSIVFNVFSRVEKALSEFFKANNNKINLVDLLATFKGVDEEVVDAGFSMLFIKKAFLGGEKEVLTAKELRRLMLMLADAGKIIFDIVNLPNIEHSKSEREDIVESLKEDFETIVVNLKPQAEMEASVFKLQDIFDVVEAYLPDYREITKYKKSILKIKEILLGSASETFTSEEVRILFQDIILKNLKRGTFFFKAYEANKFLLNSKRRVQVDLPYVFAASPLEKEFKEDFNRIAKDYRFFPNKDLLTSYHSKYDRSAWGMFVISVLEDLTARFYSHYAPRDSVSYGGYKLTQKQMSQILVDFKDIFVGSGFALPNREVNTSETITLMTSLFQYQSDGNGDDIEVNETVEFLVSVASAYRVADKADRFLKNKCQIDEKGRYSPTCFRENFTTLFELELDNTTDSKPFSFYYPGLSDYAKELDEYAMGIYLDRVETFTRTCTTFDNGEDVPMGFGDMFLIFAGLINMESTFVRFNQPQFSWYEADEKLSPEELRRAFKEVYSEAIESQVPSILAYTAEDVFRFLLDKGREPNLKEMIFRIAVVGYPSIYADRNSIAGVLKVISQSSEAKKNNTFACDSLR